MPILEDIYGDTALDYALREDHTQRNVANQILLGIEKYPFMHSGFTLVSGILKAFENDCPACGQFLDSRLVVSEHLDCTSLSRKCLNPENLQTHDNSELNYTTMIANPWENKETLT